MQLVEPIEVTCRDDDALLLETYLAYEDVAMPRRDKWMSRTLEVFANGLIGLGIGLTARHGLGLEPNAAGFLGIMAAIFAWYFQRWRWQHLALKMAVANDTGGWGRIVNRFDPDGFEAVDDLRHWRTDWRGIARVDLTPRGLTVATKGAVFVLPTDFWETRAAMEADAAQIRAWWQAAVRSR